MYKTKDTTKKELKGVEILNQDLIVEQTGSKLNLERAHDIIKNASSNFSKAEVKAQEADTLLHQLLNREVKASSSGVKTKTTKTLSKEAIRIRQKQQEGELILLELELELELESNKKSA